MAIDESFKDFVLDQLSDIPDICAKRMFGGFGLYSGTIFFGIISDDVLYFKTNQDTRTRYTEADSQPFQPNPKQTLKNYFDVPADTLEDSTALLQWADEAISVASKNK